MSNAYYLHMRGSDTVRSSLAKSTWRYRTAKLRPSRHQWNDSQIDAWVCLDNHAMAAVQPQAMIGSCKSNFPSTCSEQYLLGSIKEIIITSALTLYTSTAPKF